MISAEIVQSKESIHLSTPPNRGPAALPKSMRRLRSVDTKQIPISLCHHDGITYVGIDEVSTIDKITANGEVHKCFISVWGIVSSLQVFKGEIYVAVCIPCNGNFKIMVFNLEGQLDRCWEHEDNSNFFNKLAICGEHLVMPNRRNRTLTVYNRDGSMVKSVPIPHINDLQVAVASAGSNSIIVTHFDSDSVFKMNIDSGEVLWTCKQIYCPRSVACLDDRYVYVAGDEDPSTVFILDAHTGICLIFFPIEFRSCSTAG